MCALLLLTLWTGNPPELIEISYVDWIERNTVYSDQTGAIRLEQWIFWDHAKERSRVAGWAVYRGELVERHNQGWRLRWFENGVLREVRAASCQRTWTPTDPECDDRGWWPQEWRRLPARRR